MSHARLLFCLFAVAGGVGLAAVGLIAVSFGVDRLGRFARLGGFHG